MVRVFNSYNSKLEFWTGFLLVCVIGLLISLGIAVILLESAQFPKTFRLPFIFQEAFGQLEPRIVEEAGEHCAHLGGPVFRDDGVFDICRLDDPHDPANVAAQCPGIVERWMNGSLEILPMYCQKHYYDQVSSVTEEQEQEEEEQVQQQSQEQLNRRVLLTEMADRANRLIQTLNQTGEFLAKNMVVHRNVDTDQLTLVLFSSSNSSNGTSSWLEDRVGQVASNHGFELQVYDWLQNKFLMLILTTTLPVELVQEEEEQVEEEQEETRTTETTEEEEEETTQSDSDDNTDDNDDTNEEDNGGAFEPNDETEEDDNFEVPAEEFEQEPSLTTAAPLAEGEEVNPIT